MTGTRRGGGSGGRGGRTGRRAGSRGKVTLALVGLVALVLVGWLIRDGDSPPDLRTVPARTLPAEAAATLDLIDHHQARYRQDGEVFHNNEGELPSEPDGYYHAYTVPTPRSADRGARRLVTGGHGELFYTADHYDSFVRVDTGK